MNRSVRSRPAGPREAGFTYVEILVASAIIATVVTAGVNVLVMQAAHRRSLEDLALANELAAGLLAEMEGLPFEEPDLTVGFGPEVNPDENEVTSPASRSEFDDVDDYDGWSATPPQTADGESLAGFEGYTRSVDVVNAASGALTTPVADGTTDVKRITVTVSEGGTDLVTLTRYRTRERGVLAP